MDSIDFNGENSSREILRILMGYRINLVAFSFSYVIIFTRRYFIMAQNLQKMFCPSCGAPIIFEEGREDTFCSHCGCQLHRDDENIVRKMEHVERKLEHEEKKMEYTDRHEEREHEIDKMITENRLETKNFLIMVVITVIVIIIMAFLFKFG